MLLKLIRGIGVCVVFLSVLAPLSVLYREVRTVIKQPHDADAELISEFELFRAALDGGHVSLVEPADLATTESIRRLFLAQFALAPVLVTQASQSVRLINSKVHAVPPAHTTLKHSAHYVLVEE